VPHELHPAALAFRRGTFTREVYGIGMPDGGRRWLLASGHLLDPGTSSDMLSASDMVLSFSDITADRENLDRLIHQANHDPLTGLPNRAVILCKIAEALVSKGHARLRAVLFIDLDGLKATNDTWGHEAGDELLKAAALRLRQSVGPADAVGRLGGDEFVLLIHGYDDEEFDIVNWAARLRARLAEPVDFAQTTIPLRASVGIIDIDRDDRRSVAEILRDADHAMYEAKRANGRSRV
jgi:diguanylate cyclase (GGDEF)-like protein